MARKQLHKVLTVDPGWHTAVAYWSRETGLHPKTFLLNAPKVDDKIVKMQTLTDEFEIIVSKFEPVLVVIEDVGLWGNDARSNASAQRGDTFTLAMLVGMYIRVCYQWGASVTLLRPIDWKGNMNKDIVKERVKRRNCMSYEDFHGAKAEHVYDSVGIGLSVMGIL